MARCYRGEAEDAAVNSPGAFNDFFSEYVDSNSNFQKKHPIDIPSIDAAATEQDRRNALKSVLVSIAETEPLKALDDGDVAKLVSFFDNLYVSSGDSQFRHMYSEVCEIMYGFLSDGTGELVEGVPDKAVQLANSLGIIAAETERRGPASNSCKGVRKLLDHVNLELTRIRYITEQNKTVMQTIKENRESAEEYENKLCLLEEERSKQAAELNDKVEQRLSDMQKNYISILGIFASIVVAFTSGAAFSSSVLQNIDKSSAYRLSFMVLVIGMFMFLMVTALFVFLNRISGINNDKMFTLIKWGAIACCILIALVFIARAFDILSFFPLQDYF